MQVDPKEPASKEQFVAAVTKHFLTQVRAGRVSSLLCWGSHWAVSPPTNAGDPTGPCLCPQPPVQPADEMKILQIFAESLKRRKHMAYK